MEGWLWTNCPQPPAEFITTEDEYMFRIHDLDFNITHAEIFAYHTKAPLRLHWYTEIEGVGILDGYEYTASLKSEDLFQTREGEISSLQDLAPRVLQWKNPEDENGQWIMRLYMEGHEPVSDCRVVIQPNESNSLKLQIEGVSHLRYDEIYSENLAVSVNTIVEFGTVNCGRETREECDPILRKLFPCENLVFNQDSNGVTRYVLE